MRTWRLPLPLLLLAVVALGCGTTATTVDESAGPIATAVPSVETVTPTEVPIDAQADGDMSESSETQDVAVEPTATPHPVAVADTELPSAPIGFEALQDLAAPTGPQPISIEIENIDVQDATIIPVGVDEELAFEVPPADQVGWYEFGPRPGEQGSAVLAAHIAYNGVDGVFRDLSEVQVGSIVVVGFDDGSSNRYRIDEVTDYVKEELPDSLFDRSGDSQLALITCGGSFNPQLRSYESNTVAIAVPI